MTNPVTVLDLEDRWRPLTSQEQVTAEALLQDAWAELTVRVPSVPARLQASTLNPDLVVRVVCSMVLRVLRNPDGHRQESQAIDDYTRSWTLDNAVSAGLLYATNDEIELLAAPGVPAGGIYSVPLESPVKVIWV